MSASFADWVSTADAVRATAKKLEKHAVLARYLGSLEDGDLVIAARLLAGAPFPRRDERVLSVGWSALSDVLLERSAARAQRRTPMTDFASQISPLSIASRARSSVSVSTSMSSSSSPGKRLGSRPLQRKRWMYSLV